MNDVPKDKKTLSFQCSKAFAAKIEQAARYEDRSASAWLRNAARAALGEQEQTFSTIT